MGNSKGLQDADDKLKYVLQHLKKDPHTNLDKLVDDLIDDIQEIIKQNPKKRKLQQQRPKKQNPLNGESHEMNMVVPQLQVESDKLPKPELYKRRNPTTFNYFRNDVP